MRLLSLEICERFSRRSPFTALLLLGLRENKAQGMGRPSSPPQKPWRNGAAKFRDLDGRSSPPLRDTSDVLDAHNIQTDQLKATVSDLNTRLLQANARIAAQAEALTEAAAEAERSQSIVEENEVLRHRCGGLEAELNVTRRQLDELRQAVETRDAAWQHHHSLQEVMRSHAQAMAETEERFTAELNLARVNLAAEQADREHAEQALDAAKAQGKRWRESLQETEARRQALDTRCVAQSSELSTVKAHARELKRRASDFKAEKTALLREVDKNTSSAILRREELYFTRTNMLKEQLRLRGELERKPLPDPEPPSAEPPNRDFLAKRSWELAPPNPAAGPSRTPAADSPRQRRVYTPTARPAEPPPTTFVHGLSPRNPRSVDPPEEFETELLNEFRAASRAAAYTGAKPSSMSPEQDATLRGAERVADAVGIQSPDLTDRDSPPSAWPAMDRHARARA